MSEQPANVYLGNEFIGNASNYTAIPAVMCPKCGARLHQLFNTTSTWKFICMDENLLVIPGSDIEPVSVKVVK